MEGPGAVKTSPRRERNQTDEKLKAWTPGAPGRRSTVDLAAGWSYPESRSAVENLNKAVVRRKKTAQRASRVAKTEIRKETSGPDGKYLDGVFGVVSSLEEVSWSCPSGRYPCAAAQQSRLDCNVRGLTTRPSRKSFELLVCLN